MTLVFRCPFCSVEQTFKLSGNYKAERTAAKLTCGACRSTVHMDIKLRRAHKSAALKKREEKWNVRVEERAQAMFERSIDSFSPFWRELSGHDQRLWRSRAASELRKEGAGP